MFGLEIGVKVFPLKRQQRYFDAGFDKEYKELWLVPYFFVIIFYKNKIE